jgi:hypothetical protein
VDSPGNGKRSNFSTLWKLPFQTVLQERGRVAKTQAQDKKHMPHPLVN